MFPTDTTAGGWALNGRSVYYPDPFADMASTAMPVSNRHAQLWNEFVASANGVYRSALERVLSYFITDIDFSSNDDTVGDDVKDDYRRVFKDVLGVDTIAHAVGMDFLVSGISFTTVLAPFRRFLACPGKHCGHRVMLSAAYNASSVYNMTISNGTIDEDGRNAFRGSCPCCGKSGNWAKEDRREFNEQRLGVIRWDPKQIDIQHNSVTRRSRFIWRIPETIRIDIKRGYEHYLEDTPWEIVNAAVNNLNLKFADDAIFHFKEEPLAGLEMKGWGLSRMLANFRYTWYCQTLFRFNEAIANDYIVPLRMLMPSPGRSGDAEAADPFLNIDMSDGFVGRMSQILQAHRLDPGAWHTSGIPVDYKMLGGEAKQLAPFELLDQGLSVLLNNIGIPVELYKGTLQLQAAPVALRLFESVWRYLVHGLNRFIQRLADDVARILRWKPIKVKFKSVTLVDDLQAVQEKLQLSMAKSISQTDVLSSLGMDFRDQQRKIMAEAKFVAELQQKMKDDLDSTAMQQGLGQQQPGQAQPGQQPDQPGQPAPAGGGSPAAAAMPISDTTKASPGDIMERAKGLAEQMIQMGDSERHTALLQLKQSEPTIHLVVNGILKNWRSSAGSAGRQQIMGAYQQGQAA